MSARTPYCDACGSVILYGAPVCIEHDLYCQPCADAALYGTGRFDGAIDNLFAAIDAALPLGTSGSLQ